MELLVNIPTQNKLRYTRVVSDAGGIYFVAKSDDKILAENKLNYIDTDLRIICSYISQKGFSVYNYNAASGFDKKQFEKLYNAYKNDEKDMRKNGVFLNYLDGSRANMKIERYRFNYGSFEQFIQEYPKDRQKQFLCFYMNDDDYSRKILDKIKVYNDVIVEYLNEKIYFNVNFDVGDLQFSTPIWRNFTANLVKTIEEEQETI